MTTRTKPRRIVQVIAGVALCLSACGPDKQAGLVLHVDTDPVALRAAIVSLRVTVDGRAQIYQPTALPGSLGIRTSPGDKHIIVEGPASLPIARWEGSVAAQADKATDYTVVLQAIQAGQLDGGDGDAPLGTGGAVGDGAVGSDGTLGAGGAVGIDAAGGAGGASGSLDAGGGGSGGALGAVDAGGPSKAMVVRGQLGTRGAGSVSAGIYRVTRDGLLLGPRVCAGNVCQSGGIAR